VVWTAIGDGLSSTEFGEFNMQGKVGDKATSISWKAHQTYKDGSVVDWVGAADADKPASITTVIAKPTGETMVEHVNTASTAKSNSNTALYLSIAALVLGVLAIILALRKKLAIQ
jgi:uncharacterized protein YcnI